MPEPSQREQWVFVFEALPGDVPAANRVRQLLKTALRRDGLKCVSTAGPDLQAELARMQGIIDGLAACVAAQAELLARRAEKGEPAGVSRPR